MNHPGLDDRRLRWRVIVLLIFLAMIAGLTWYGYDVMAALGLSVVILVVAAVVAIPLIIDGPISAAGRTTPAVQSPALSLAASAILGELARQQIPAPFEPATPTAVPAPTEGQVQP